MTSNKQQHSNTNKTLDYSHNVTSNDATQGDLSLIDTAKPASELQQLEQTEDRLVREKILEEDPALSAIRNKYNIPLEIAENLLKLRKFEIVIVCDDSGSMETLVDGTQRTRWDELRSIVKIVLDISVSFALNGVDIHFLNGRNLFKVKDPGIIDQAFAKSPCGYTPLVPVLKKIFTSDLARRGRDKKLLVFVATDGQPTDDNGNPQVDELKHLMQETRQSVTTHVTFLLCTDDQDSVGYLDKWDKEMKNVDVTDDYNTETKKIRQYRGDNYPFSYGDYVVKALAGAIIQAIDIINEPD